jgi:hypothetical protein
MFRTGAATGIGRHDVAKLFYTVRKEFTFLSFLTNGGSVGRHDEKKRRPWGH